MKKSKILLFAIIGLLIFGFNNKVMAANSDKVVGLLECTYDIGHTDGRGISKHYQENGVMRFYYTDLEFNAAKSSDEVIQLGQVAQKLYLKDVISNSFVNVRNLTSDKAKFFSGNMTIDDAEFLALQEEFIQIFNNTGECPKTFLVQKYVYGQNGVIEGKIEGKYITRFTDNVPCGGDDSSNSKCQAIGKLREDLSGKTEIVAERERWSHTFKGTGTCSGLGFEIFASFYDNTPLLKSSISYSESATMRKYTFVEFKAVNTQGSITSDLYGEQQMKMIYNLIKNNKIEAGYVRVDSFKEQVAVGYGELSDPKAENYCAFENLTLNEFVCASPDTYNSTINSYVGTIAKNLQNVDDFMPGNITYSYPPYDKIDYSTYNDTTELYNIANRINTKRKDIEKMIYDYQKLDLYLNGILNNVCADVSISNKKNLNEAVTKLKNNRDLMVAKLGTFQEALGSIKDRISELGNNALAGVIDSYIKDYQDLKKEYESLSFVSEDSLLTIGDVNLEYREGCATISDSLYAWLAQLLDLIKIGALILTLILGMVDFLKGVASGNADTMKKVWTSLARRLIAVVLLFLLPVILEFILGLVNINGVGVDPLCGLK